MCDGSGRDPESSVFREMFGEEGGALRCLSGRGGSGVVQGSRTGADCSSDCSQRLWTGNSVIYCLGVATRGEALDRSIVFVARR